jgi:5-methylcytosine-specific restriction endonuclease McrA
MIKKSKSTRSKKITKLDNVFSEFIRKRDCAPYGRCISCGKVITYDTADCGHYINRKHMATRYDENNCNAQCRSCNRFDEGNLQGYRRGLINKYGEKITDNLEIKKHNISKLSEAELDILIAYYKTKIKEL